MDTDEYKRISKKNFTSVSIFSKDCFLYLGFKRMDWLM